MRPTVIDTPATPLAPLPSTPPEPPLRCRSGAVQHSSTALEPSLPLRRAILRAAGLGLALGALGPGLPSFTSGAEAPGAAPAPVVAKPGPVAEIHAFSLREEDGSIRRLTLIDLVDGGINTLANEQYPLDGWEKLLGGATSCGVEIVEGTFAGSRRKIADHLAESLGTYGLEAKSLLVWNATARGAVTEPGRKSETSARPQAQSAHGETGRSEKDPAAPLPKQDASDPPNAKGRAPSGKTLGSNLWIPEFDQRVQRTVVVATLAADGDRMAPFAIDAVIRATRGETRARALADPLFAARLCLDPSLKDRIIAFVGDLISIRLDGGTSAPGTVWNADEILVSADPLAAQRIGYRILNNARRGRGLPQLAPDPVLEAAEKAGLIENGVGGIDWTKLAF